ncbi:hypothetical protein DFP72DRAFT_857182 [Ephemerocybe angulata]|uniref:Uncharacterized protein n=1 Tax=Ephemerocybe angulata TaxID=980116 RepID=A0A8H6LXD0_9AGAR|nr:hypothetical protein DFP72DRAFT_857182 [Tulosesus angulatus]
MDSEDVMKANPNYRRDCVLWTVLTCLVGQSLRGASKAGKSMQTICKRASSEGGRSETVVAGGRRGNQIAVIAGESLATSTHRTNTTLTTNGDFSHSDLDSVRRRLLGLHRQAVKAMCWSVGDVQDLGTGADEIGEGMKSLPRNRATTGHSRCVAAEGDHPGILLNSLKRRLMVVTRVAWEWMDTNVEGPGAHIISGKPATFSAQSFLRDLFAKDSTFTASSRRNCAFQGRQHRELQRRHAIHLLAKWFDFPNSLSEYAQGRFVKVVSDRFGTEVLYVSSVWEVYKNVARAIDPKNRRITTKKVDSWIALLTTTVGHSKYDGVHTKLRGLGVLLSAAARESTGLDKWDAQLPAQYDHTFSAQPLQNNRFKRLFRRCDGSVHRPNRTVCIRYSTLPGIEPIKPPRSAPTIEQKLYAYLKMVFDNNRQEASFPRFRSIPQDDSAAKRTILFHPSPHSGRLLQRSEIVFEGVEDYFEVCQSMRVWYRGRKMHSSVTGVRMELGPRLSPDSATQFWETTGDESTTPGCWATNRLHSWTWYARFHAFDGLSDNGAPHRVSIGFRLRTCRRGGEANYT